MHKLDDVVIPGARPAAPCGAIDPPGVLFLQCRMPFAIIIVIGWLYVTLLAAFTESSVVAGFLSFLFSGLLPCGLILYFAGSKIRRQRRRYREMIAEREAGDAAD